MRWEDDVKKDIQGLKVPNWKTLVQGRRKWKEWLRRPKHCTKSCRAVLKGRSVQGKLGGSRDLRSSGLLHSV